MELRTGYYAKMNRYIELGYEVFGISAYVPKGIKILCLDMFAPSKDLLKKYKNGVVTVEEYKDLYMKQLACSHGIIQVLEFLRKYDKVVLLCYEKSDVVCHRHFLAEYLKINYKLDVKELEV